MGKVRGELEDLAFRYTDPVSYEQVSAAVEARRIEGEQFLRGVEDTLVEQLRENNIEARVEWRIKRLYSIYQKIERSKVSFDQVYDLLAVRVITQDVAPATPSSASSTPCGGPSPAASRTSSPFPAPTAISRCTPRSSAKAATSSKCRFAPKRCTGLPKKESPPTGSTRPATARSPRATKSGSIGFASSSSGKRR
jgi:hypothetical protein